MAADFDAGLISHSHAAIVLETLATLPPEVAVDAEPVLREVARRLDTGRLREAARRLRFIADPDGQAGIDARHHESRWLDIATTFNGMMAVTGMLDPETGATLRTALSALDLPGIDDTRTASSRRADALGELARRALDNGELPGVGGERPHLNVTVDYATLLGVKGSAPAELEWAGPVGNDTLRRLGCDAGVTRILYTTEPELAARYLAENATAAAVASAPAHEPSSDNVLELPPPPGSLLTLEPLIVPGSPYWQALPLPLRARSLPLDVGRASRLGTAAQRKAAVVRDGGCAIPDCDRPPSWCDLHHILHWADGGATCLDNLCLLCRRHHTIVHKEHWLLRLRPDGTLDARPPSPPELELVP